MTEYLTRARTFWAGRTPRERTLLAAGIAVVLCGLAYALIVDPLLKANGKLAASLPQQRAELRLAQAQASEIERLQRGHMSVARTGGALVHAVETSAAANGVRDAVTNLAPLPGGDRVRVSTGPMAVTAWLAWFADLEQEGIGIVSYRAVMDPRPGLISVEAMLGRGS
ncbi:MAG: type II secretion system protein M [Gallionellaceae bacterium]|nr:type II secretion system protein M [Gallionellaceae bacterium]